MLKLDDVKIGVVGLGYVGLPLALEFGKRYPVLGFDISKARIAELQSGKDSTLEADAEVAEIQQAVEALLERQARIERLDARGRARADRGRRQAPLQLGSRGARRLQCLHHHGADTGRAQQPAAVDASEAGQ